MSTADWLFVYLVRVCKVYRLQQLSQLVEMQVMVDDFMTM